MRIAFENLFQRRDRVTCDRFRAQRAVVKQAVKVAKRMADCHEGDLGQQSDELRCRHYNNALKIGRSWEPWCICRWLSFTHRNFYLALCSFGLPSHALEDYHLQRGVMPLHDTVRVNGERAKLVKIKVEVLRVSAKGCMVYNCLCVIWLDMTTAPWQSEKVMAYYICLSIKCTY